MCESVEHDIGDNEQGQKGQDHQNQQLLLAEDDTGGLRTGDIRQVPPRDEIGGTLDRVNQSSRTFQPEGRESGGGVWGDR